MRGKIALVTGGANGIGRATAAALLSAGVHVAAVDLDHPGLEDSKKEFSGHDGRHVTIHADLSRLETLQDIVDQVLREFGRLDYLVNSAAILGGTLDVLAVEGVEWDRIFDVNLKAPMLLMQAFGRHVVGRGGDGRIVNVTSSSAFRAMHTKPAYGSAKAALGALTRIAAAQLGAHNINVNAVAPGVTNTPGAGSKRNVDMDMMIAKVSEGPQENFFKRVSEPEDVAATIVFLCSPASQQITGQTIHVSAGAVTL